MFLLRKFRFKALAVIILVPLAVAMTMRTLATNSNHADDIMKVDEKQLTTPAADAAPLPVGHVTNTQTLSAVMYIPVVN